MAPSRRRRAAAAVTFSEMYREPVDLAKSSPLEVHGKVAELACRRRAGNDARLEGMAELFGFPKGWGGAQDMVAVLQWVAFLDAWWCIERDYVREEWSTRVAYYSVVRMKLHGYVKESPASNSSSERSGIPIDKPLQGLQGSERDPEMQAEDYYASGIKALIRELHSDSDRNGGISLQWLRSAARAEQVFILHHLLLFRHFQEKRRLWKKLPLRKKICDLWRKCGEG